jgi:hypothetical protein
METRVEQETDYESEAREILTILDDGPGFPGSELYSVLSETLERSDEYEISELRYVAKDGGIYLLGQDEGEMIPDIPLVLNGEQERAVQAALSGGMMTVEVLTPFGTEEMEAWSIQTFACGEPTPDGEPTFVLSAVSEERPKVLREPEEEQGGDIPAPGYTGLEVSGGAVEDVLTVRAPETVTPEIPSTHLSSEGLGADSHVGEDIEAANVQPQETAPVERILTEIAAIFAPPVEVTQEIEQIAPIVVLTEKSNESGDFELTQVMVAESEEITDVVDMQEVPDEVLVTEPEQVATEVQQDVILVEPEWQETQPVDLLELSVAPVKPLVLESCVETNLPAVLQPNEIIHLRQEPMPVQASNIKPCVAEEERAVESTRRAEPVLRVIRKVEREQDHDDRQDVQSIIEEDAVEQRGDDQLYDTILEITPAAVRQPGTERVKAVVVQTPERAAMQPKKITMHEVQSSSWEKSDRVGLSDSRAGGVGPVFDEDDIVVSFEYPRSSRQNRRVRARSMAA